MIELGQLERRNEDFTRRNTQVIASSVEGTEIAKKTQAELGHLKVLADQGRGLTDAAKVVHAHAGPDGGDVDLPVTILVDRQGIVRWLFQPSMATERLSPDEVLQAIDQHLPATSK
jgi:alkyl hydroperoxide reductase subunit AhpC